MALPRDQHLWVVSADCVDCRACEEACRRRHGVSRLEVGRHPLGVSLPVVCRHCDDPLCLTSCISGAIGVDEATGAVLCDADRCVGCWSCAMVCPHAAVRRHVGKRPISSRCSRCAGHFRPACVTHCPTGALRSGAADRLHEAMAQTASPGGSLLKAAGYLLLPVLGLLLGMWSPARDAAMRHSIAKAAAGLMVLSLLLPALGRLFSSVVRRSPWTDTHLAVGSLAGSFGLNVQSLAAASLLGLAVTGAAYRHVYPLWLQVAQALERARHVEGTSLEARSESGRFRLAAAEAAARVASRWAGVMRSGGAVLAACKTIHIVWAVATLGLVTAHAVVMTMTGATP